MADEGGLNFGGFGLNYDQGFRPMGAGGTFGGGGGGGGGGGWNPLQGDLEKALEAQRQAGENYRAQVAANANTYPATLKQQRFNQIWPWVQGQFGSQGGVPPAAGVPTPQFNTSNPWDPQRTQQNVNAARAFGDQATQSKINSMESEAAGRGFGANSPLAAMLKAQYQAAGMANNANQEREIRNTAAQQNTQQMMNLNQLQENRRAAQAGEQLTGRGQDVQARNAWISALSGFVS